MQKNFLATVAHFIWAFFTLQICLLHSRQLLFDVEGKLTTYLTLKIQAFISNKKLTEK